MLSISNDGKPASADEFLPCLIYVCLKESIVVTPLSDKSSPKCLNFANFRFDMTLAEIELQYVLIFLQPQANPPRIQSNINFVTRFCNEDKLRMGEAGYFFANFVSFSFLLLTFYSTLFHSPKYLFP